MPGRARAVPHAQGYVPTRCLKMNARQAVAHTSNSAPSGPGGELQWLLAGDACASPVASEVCVAERSIAERHEYVHVLVGRQINGRAGRYCAPPHSTASR